MTFRQMTLSERLAADGTLSASESKTGISGGAVRLDPAAPVSTIRAVGAATNTFTLSDGIVVGQRKSIVLAAKGGSGNAVITPANLNAGTTITLDAAEESVSLVWATSGWNITGGQGTLA